MSCNKFPSPNIRYFIEDRSRKQFQVKKAHRAKKLVNPCSDEPKRSKSLQRRLITALPNEVKWRPGHEASLATPCSFRSKRSVLKKTLVILLEFFGAFRSHLAPPE